MERLASGTDVALVTDAGTPVVSDPGAALVRAARAEGVRVTPIPGVSAVTTLLSIAGIDITSVRFIGFLPRAGTDRDHAIATISASSDATLFFEAPHRMAETLELLATRIPQRLIVIGRELTKMHEEVLVGLASEIAGAEASRPWLGEIAVVVAPLEQGRTRSRSRRSTRASTRSSRAVAGRRPLRSSSRSKRE